MSTWATNQYQFMSYLYDIMYSSLNCQSIGRSIGGQGGGGPDRGFGPPEKSQIAILVQIPENYKATKPAFNVGSLSACQRNAI